MSIQEKIKIKIDNEEIVCLLNYQKDKNEINTIILHGGGPSNKEQTEYLIPVLQKNNLYSVRFDFSGQGESSGNLSCSSLYKRQKESLGVIKEFIGNNRLTIIGTSMAGHISCSLVVNANVENLVLFCPAIYTKKAWFSNFGNGFTDIIRENKSYLDNNISQLLKKFDGKIMLILAENDQIIPNEVVDIYLHEMKNKPGSKVYVIKGCPHPIHKWIIQNEQEREKLISEIDWFLGYKKNGLTTAST